MLTAYTKNYPIEVNKDSSMKSALKPALENLDKALGQLETAIEQRFHAVKKQKEEPQLDLSSRNERDVNRKIAAKLDQTINRLEMLLTEE